MHYRSFYEHQVVHGCVRLLIKQLVNHFCFVLVLCYLVLYIDLKMQFTLRKCTHRCSKSNDNFWLCRMQPSKEAFNMILFRHMYGTKTDHLTERKWNGESVVKVKLCSNLFTTQFVSSTFALFYSGNQICSDVSWVQVY